MATQLAPAPRAALVRRGQWLSVLTLGYNSLEGIVAVGAGVLAGSVALVGFGIDSGIELAASGAALWRLSADLDPVRRDAAERTTLRVVGALFLALAAEATQTALCTWLSAILLGGLALNALLGWWWADPVAALVMVPIIAREGVEGLRGRDPCSDGCATCHAPGE